MENLGSYGTRVLELGVSSCCESNLGLTQLQRDHTTMGGRLIESKSSS